jgi:hypothetical protein
MPNIICVQQLTGVYVSGTVILKQITEIVLWSTDLIQLAQDWIQWRAVLNITMKLMGQ